MLSFIQHVFTETSHEAFLFVVPTNYQLVTVPLKMQRGLLKSQLADNCT